MQVDGRCYLARNGGEWYCDAEWLAPMASVASMVAHQGTDVEVLLCSSRDECTHRSSLFDRQQTTSRLRLLVMTVNVVTVFTMAVVWCSLTRPRSGPFFPRQKGKGCQHALRAACMGT